MSLKEKLESDFGKALRERNAVRLETIRMIRAAVHNREIEKRSKGGEVGLTDEELTGIFAKEAKKRKEAANFFVKGNRPELARKENEELTILGEYLPKQMSREEVEAVVDEAISATMSVLGGDAARNFGVVMAAAMGRLKGRADAAETAKLVKRKLEPAP